MAYRKKERDINIVHFSFFDLLFGAFGAFVFLMIVQIISTINMLDVDMVKLVDKVVKEKKILSQEVENYKEKSHDLVTLKEEHQQTLEENRRLSEDHAELARQITVMETELKTLNEFKARAAASSSTLKALQEENKELLTSLKAADRKLSLLKTAALKIKTTSLPVMVASETATLAMAAEGGKLPYRWTLAGELPAGLIFNPMTGMLSGTPRGPGRASLKLAVADATGATDQSAEMALKVIPQPLPEKRKVSPWFLIMATISSMLLFIILWDRYKKRKYYKEMIAKGYKPVWQRTQNPPKA
jgi:hypothetical protein